MPYTADEQARLQRLTEIEATLVDLAKHTIDDTLFGGRTQKFVALVAIVRYATAESLSAECQQWLKELLHSI